MRAIVVHTRERNRSFTHVRDHSPPTHATTGLAHMHPLAFDTSTTAGATHTRNHLHHIHAQPPASQAPGTTHRTRGCDHMPRAHVQLHKTHAHATTHYTHATTTTARETHGLTRPCAHRLHPTCATMCDHACYLTLHPRARPHPSCPRATTGVADTCNRRAHKRLRPLATHTSATSPFTHTGALASHHTRACGHMPQQRARLSHRRDRTPHKHLRPQT
jgi:hypothetical protein